MAEESIEFLTLNRDERRMVFANPFAAILAPPMGGSTTFRTRMGFPVAAVGTIPFAATHIIGVLTASRLAADRARRVVSLH